MNKAWFYPKGAINTNGYQPLLLGHIFIDQLRHRKIVSVEYGQQVENAV